MTHRIFRFAILVSLCSFLTAAATAQDSSGQPGRRLPSQLGVGDIVVPDPREQAIGLAEDTEIMGQILDDALEGLYQQHAEVFIWDMISGQTKRPTTGKIRAPHAVYLDRYGVVYQLEAPPLHQVPKKVKAKVRPTRKPLTVWEKTRRRLRGEKVEDASTASASLSGVHYFTVEIKPVAKAPTEEQLVRKLLDMLAKNGHNFRHLAPEERLTVAITFRKTAPSDAGKRQSSLYRNLGNGRFQDVNNTAGLSEPAVGRGVAVGDFDGDGGLDLYLTGDTGDKTHELTGDLRLRQGELKKAIEAYEKALRQSFPNLGNYYIRMNFPPGGVKPEKRRLMQKLSQAQIGAGNFDKARQLLDNLSRAVAAANDALKSKSKAHAKSSLPFSAQLVVSVKKADLDAVAAGKIKSEEFKKRATVRYFDPGTFKQKESK